MNSFRKEIKYKGMIVYLSDMEVQALYLYQ